MNQANHTHGLVNYDQTDPDKMRLPSGKTCGDCVHIRRCNAIFGHTAEDTYCDWSPSRAQWKPVIEATGSAA